MEQYYRVTIVKGKQPLWFTGMTLTLDECKILDECLMPDSSLQIDKITDEMNSLFNSLIEASKKVEDDGTNV